MNVLLNKINFSVTHALLVALLLLALVFPAQKTEAGNPVGVATELTQLMNNVELVAILGKEAEQLLQLIETYQLMLEEAKKLPTLIQQNVANTLMNLARNTEIGQAITYASAIGDRLDHAYRTMQQYEDFLETASLDDKARRFQEMARTGWDTIYAALTTANLQHELFDDESRAVETMMNQMKTAKGQNQILQAGFSIAQAQVAQMQKLRQLIMTQNNLQAEKAGRELDQMAKEEAGWKKFATPHREITPFTGQPMTLQEKLRRMRNQ